MCLFIVIMSLLNNIHIDTFYLRLLQIKITEKRRVTFNDYYKKKKTMTVTPVEQYVTPASPISFMSSSPIVTSLSPKRGTSQNN